MVIEQSGSWHAARSSGLEVWGSERLCEAGMDLPHEAGKNAYNNGRHGQHQMMKQIGELAEPAQISEAGRSHLADRKETRFGREQEE